MLYKYLNFVLFINLCKYFYNFSILKMFFLNFFIDPNPDQIFANSIISRSLRFMILNPRIRIP